MLLSYVPAADSDNPLGEAVLPCVLDASFSEITDIRVERVVHALGAEPSRAEFGAVLDSYHTWMDGSGETHSGALGFEQAVPPGTLSVHVDDVVYVALPMDGGGRLVIFRGRITDVDVSFGESGEGVRITALGPTQALDNTDLRGARFADPSGGVLQTDASLVFNPDNLGNYDAAGTASEGEPLFGDPVESDATQSDPFGNFWTIARFWKYVVGNFAPADDCRGETAQVPLLSDADDAILPPTDVDGWKPSAALSRVLGAYGLDWWADPFVFSGGWSPWGSPALPVLRIISPASAPTKTVSLQPRGSLFSANETNIDAGAMSFTTRSSINHWRIEGDYREYESAFELKKLWADEEEGTVSGNLNCGNRASIGFDPFLDHVYRQWGLNEDGQWESRGAFDFKAMLGEGTWTRRRRRLLPPWSETDEPPHKGLVEVKSDALDSQWHTVGSGTVRFLTDRAGIYFDMADVDGTNSRLRVDNDQTVALKDVSGVRITAIVKSDERVVYDAPRQDSAGSTQTITRTLRNGSFRWIKRYALSAYASEQTAVVRNDAEDGGPMEQLASKLREHVAPMNQRASLSMPWVDCSYRVGDRISGVAGRDLGFRAQPGDPPVYPAIERVTYDFAKQETELGLRMPVR